MIGIGITKCALEQLKLTNAKSTAAIVLATLQNENNEIILDPTIFDNFIRSLNAELKPVYQQMLVHLADTNRIHKIPSEKVSSIFELYSETPSQGSYVKASLNGNSITDQMFTRLATVGSCTFDNLDFATDNDIKSSIEILNKISVDRKLRILSRYVTYHTDLFNWFSNNICSVDLWTIKSDAIPRTELAKTFKVRKINIFHCSKESLHERTILLGKSLIITADDNFDKVTKNYSTWRISIYLCESKMQKKIERLKGFVRQSA